MFYGQAGGKDLLQRKWKDLSEFVTLECDGKDITGKLREQKVHAVLFLNIPSYGGGTHPWAGNHGQAQATDDGLIEVVGLTTYQLPLLQAGGHGTCLAQCRTARIVTRRVIPMQVDGEACRLNPAIINLQLLNQAPVLAKRRGGFERNRAPIVETLRMHVKRISMADYEVHHYEKEALQAAGWSISFPFLIFNLTFLLASKLTSFPLLFLYLFLFDPFTLYSNVNRRDKCESRRHFGGCPPGG